MIKNEIYKLREKIFSPKGFQIESNVVECNDYICEKIKCGDPFLVSRFGNVELDVLLNYKSILENKNFALIRKYIKGEKSTRWEDGVKKRFNMNAGFYPLDEKFIIKYCDLIIKNLQEIDLLGSWISREIYFENQLSKAVKFKLNDIEPFFVTNKWTHALEKKTILVVHPQSNLILKQYKNKELYWPKLLPEFNLIGFEAIQTNAGAQAIYGDWFEALDFMMQSINGISFDVAIIGAGAYGMPLAMHVKKIGKQAIHLGGVTQLLFGIKGRRWTDDPKYSSFMNDYWVNPDPKHIPPEAAKVENGCYW